MSESSVPSRPLPIGVFPLPFGYLLLPENESTAAVRAGAQVLGSVKSHGQMAIEAGVRIRGSLISSSTMHIGPDCRINGPVIAEHGMAIDTGTHCGSIHVPTTVTAPTIHIANGVTVFGTVWARTEGQVVSLG